MTKLSKYSIDAKYFERYINNLWSAFTLMDSKEDIRLLFRDLFTHTEYKMLTKRLEIARRLLDGQIYQDIQRALRVTSVTIATINNTLNRYGEGFRKAHQKLSEIEEKHRKTEARRLEEMANPFLKKIRSKRALVTLVGAGLQEVDKSIRKNLRRRSAKTKFTV